MLDESDPMWSKFRWFDFPTLLFEDFDDLISRGTNCVCAYCQHWLFVRCHTYFVCLFLTMALLDETIEISGKAYPYMLRHLFFFFWLLFLPPLECITFICMESIEPIDWLPTHESKICFPSHQCITVLNYIHPLLRCVFILFTQKIIA